MCPLDFAKVAKSKLAKMNERAEVVEWDASKFNKRALAPTPEVSKKVEAQARATIKIEHP